MINSFRIVAKGPVPDILGVGEEGRAVDDAFARVKGQEGQNMG